MTKEFKGLKDLITAMSYCDLEFHDIIENELSEGASLLYDATTDEYKIESFDFIESEKYDDTVLTIDPATFEGLEIGTCKVTKEDLKDFMEFIQYLREKGLLNK